MKIVIIGGGHLALALVTGLINHQRDWQIAVVERNAHKRAHFPASVTTYATTAEAPQAEVVILAVRPDQIQGVCAACTDTLVISVAAGIRLARLQIWLADKNCRVVRVMPNTPIAVGEGVSVAQGALSPPDRQYVQAIFSCVGKVIWLADESLMDAATAVSGCAPAYVYYLVEAMQETAAQMGLPASEAEAMIVQVCRGAAAMMAQGNSAVELRRAIMLKGGATEQAIFSLQQDAFKATVARAIQAARSRSQAIGEALDT